MRAPITFATIATVLRYQVPSIHIQSIILGEWCYSITLMLILQSFSPASPCFVYLTKCHAIPNHKGRIIPLACCQRWCLLLLQSACGHFPIPGAIPYHAIPYQELQLLSIILSSMLLPSSLASLLGTMLVYCPFYPLHKTKSIL